MATVWLRPYRWLTWFHRWGGVVLCLFFAMWFASGAVLHFVGFPALSAQERHAGGEMLDVNDIGVSPGRAIARVPGAADLRLVARAGEPAYLVEAPNGGWVAIDAKGGDVLPDLSEIQARGVAEHFSHAKAVARTGPIDYDQWIVHQRFDPFRPFYRIRLDDAHRTDLYVSARTGEVLQRTRFSERAWNWAGSIIHWTYFTPLRKNWSAWNQVVWWLSLAALLSSTVGAWLGIARMMGNRAARRRGLSPFRGWMRWHHLIGLFASVVVIAWMLSGWLSMDHGRMFSMGHATEEQARRLSGVRIGGIANGATLASLRMLGAATEITFNAVNGRPFFTAYPPGGGDARLFFFDEMSVPLTFIPDSLLLAGMRNVWPNARAATTGAGVDSLYRHAESAGAQAAAFTADDGAAGGGSPVRAYVDQTSGRFVAVMDSSRRSYAWVYYGLHTLEFPGLIEHSTLRTALVLTLLALGFASSATGVVLSVKRLKRELT